MLGLFGWTTTFRIVSVNQPSTLLSSYLLLVQHNSSRIDRAKRLCYTWRDCFATTVKHIRATDLIEHSIDLEADARPVHGTLPKHTTLEREFANRIFPEMEDAGIIARRSSPWGRGLNSLPRKKDRPTYE